MYHVLAELSLVSTLIMGHYKYPDICNMVSKHHIFTTTIRRSLLIFHLLTFSNVNQRSNHSIFIFQHRHSFNLRHFQQLHNQAILCILSQI